MDWHRASPPAREPVEDVLALAVEAGVQGDVVTAAHDRRGRVTAVGGLVDHSAQAVLDRPAVRVPVPAAGTVTLDLKVRSGPARPPDEEAAEQQFGAGGRGGRGTAGHGSLYVGNTDEVRRAIRRTPAR